MRERPSLDTPTFAPLPEPDGFTPAFADWLQSNEEPVSSVRLHSPAFRIPQANPALERVLQLSRSYPLTVVAMLASSPRTAA